MLEVALGALSTLLGVMVGGSMAISGMKKSSEKANTTNVYKGDED